MHTETLLLEFMAGINDALKSDDSETAKLEAIYRVKQWAEDEYAKLSIGEQKPWLDGDN
ncbi:hypothetical protein SAMN05216296_1034 [Pseudomonas pohangensis]|uniref:Uncharacterized protein n=1 Tax=Pseudomonas pohangensis TaxID=364197 RepID=A0A1H2ESQ4_9PSED|nr:hypothetical protein [Pseudomonas pohangensis]SDT97983.1 hypothetical protein SAMN05216296_1034 [Pseudomonas pohangensis]